MLVEQRVNVLLVHVLQQVALLVSKFPSHDLLLLSPKLLHVLVLIAFLLFIPVVQALLSLLKLRHLNSISFLKLLSLLDLFFVCFAMELF